MTNRDHAAAFARALDGLRIGSRRRQLACEAPRTEHNYNAVDDAIRRVLP